jgi:hypothetical protein
VELDPVTEITPTVEPGSAVSLSSPALSATSEVASAQVRTGRKDRIIVTSGSPRWRTVRSGLLVAASVVVLVALAWLVFWFWNPITTFLHASSQAELPAAPPAAPTSVPATGAVMQGQAAPLSGTGFLNVESDVSATIYIDGTLVGSSPVQDFPLTSGKHSLRAVVGGDRVRTLNVQISPGIATPVELTFGP